jgi:hypothetical protein
VQLLVLLQVRQLEVDALGPSGLGRLGKALGKPPDGLSGWLSLDQLHVVV